GGGGRQRFRGTTDCAGTDRQAGPAGDSRQSRAQRTGDRARAQADAYTLLINGGQLWLLPFLRKNVAYDPVRDFSPITLVVSTPGILVVHPSVPASSVKE